MHETTVLLIEVGALLLILSIVGRIALRFGISPIPLYLLAGLAVGHGGIIPLRASEEFFEVGAQIGVILLLAMLGLEYSPRELVSSLKQSRVAGIYDGLLNAIPGALFAFLLGWDWLAAVALAGITWVSSSGVIAKVLRDLGRLGNRETPVILSTLVIEDLAMAFYLPILSALLIGTGLLQGSITVAIAVGVVAVILFIALRFGKQLSRLFPAANPEPLLLGVLGLTMLVAGLAEQVSVSAAVGAFLVGIAISGQVAHNATIVLAPLRDLFATVFFVFFGLTTSPASIVPVLVPALLLAVLTMGTKLASGYLSARRAGIGVPGRWRTGLSLAPRGEFSLVIAGLAVAAGVEPTIAPLATAYVLITIIAGPLLARIPDTALFKAEVRRRRLVAEAKQAAAIT
ncbi:CPA2 family monovalent cation:H+ antiporter-2 [Microbacteriaceae bacterium SG_E_30_P1]|uniref:CPA2 family monovalent cation:H+ antiporter-2 n=1 Tax=Antiquaquibacter oligotrophicus TaxID=2880260 RepID=A0ABT6KN36_9MICO|nr:cation:proton antiporter [Antiquaquibacter oligotrophicus]MDH6181196.1 CPA2 family monovalent cation:H+ antiporter-2 [Antiquaquibacter oligotrophicus]UDF13109.1 cation:proton antiporter [Antiquaquibacter oligotrophicus]